jgi:hypothetical protein
MKRFLCWIRYGHIWNEVGHILSKNGRATMYQCAHCALTEIFDNVSGARR